MGRDKCLDFVRCFGCALCRYCLAGDGEDVEVGEGGLVGVVGVVGVVVGGFGLEKPLRLMLGDPVGEGAVVDVLVGPVLIHVAGVDDDEAAGGDEEVLHVVVEDVVLDEVVDDVEREGEVGLDGGGEETGFEETFGGIVGEESAAYLDGFGGDVDAGVVGIAGEFELSPVAAAVLDDGGDAVLLDEGVEEVGLEPGQAVVAACA